MYRDIHDNLTSLREPCMCGDPYCPFCGDPSRKDVDDALDMLMEAMAEMDISSGEIISLVEQLREAEESGKKFVLRFSVDYQE